MTFWEPEVKPDPKGEDEDYPPEPSILDVKTWLDWQACQLSTPCWWWELKAIPSMKDLQKLAHKIWASFLIPKVRSRAFPGQDFTAPPAPKCLNRNAFLPNDLLYQDVWQQPFLLTVAYARGLQYWVEKLNLPEGSNFCLLAGSVIELREMVKEHVVFTNWDHLRDLGRVDPRAMNQWPQTSSSCGIMPPLGDEPREPDTSFTEATTQTISLAMTNTKPIRHTIPPVGAEGENQYLLVITASIGKLSLESASNDLEGSSTALHGGDTFQNPRMAAVLSTTHKWQLFFLHQQGQSVMEVPL